MRSLVGIVAGVPFLHTNILHPLCGHQQFLKEYGSGPRVVYTEPDDRYSRKVMIYDVYLY
jgi:hypothetical protein